MGFRYRASSFRFIGRQLNGNSLFIRHRESHVMRVIATQPGILHIGQLETRPSDATRERARFSIARIGALRLLATIRV